MRILVPLGFMFLFGYLVTIYINYKLEKQKSLIEKEENKK